MPQYLFTNGKDIKEIFFHMNDEKRYFENGLEWDRLYTIPQSSIDTKIDPYSSKDFVRATNKKGTFGEIIERSAELSDKRGGVNDPVKQQYYKDYSKKRGGKLHKDMGVAKAKNALDKLGVTYE